MCLKGHRQAEPSWLYHLLDHAQQGMGGPRTPQQSQSSPSHPGKVQDHQTRRTHSHGAPKAAACQSRWEVVDMPAHEGGADVSRLQIPTPGPASSPPSLSFSHL